MREVITDFNRDFITSKFYDQLSHFTIGILLPTLQSLSSSAPSLLYFSKNNFFHNLAAQFNELGIREYKNSENYKRFQWHLLLLT